MAIDVGEAIRAYPHEVGARRALVDFVAASTARRPLASSEDGLRSVAIIEAVHRSLRVHVPVPVEVD